MTTLIEELRADQSPRTQCRFCGWLAERSKPERDEWAAAMLDKSYTHASLFRAAQRRGFMNAQGSVETHRTGGHRP